MLTRFFFTPKHIPPSLWNICDQTLQFTFVLAHGSGVENQVAVYMLRLEFRPEDRLHPKLPGSIPVFRVEIDIASKTPTHEVHETDYYPHKEADENI